ncbi:MAG: UDP-4-amino-4,6-dideoxy-N-acetyl-beta-L-altrosamine transaminase [Proteobacteria bacterium]|nr:UDP-4-amino-4,6-dideoxy-N-acetyl-beta-L-altrosamine transaminase [Pseudomonadota bacterium]NOG59073.1 UDP-4-amino-4,6-dideoxy-N-acetyl-beta-L-altrosamine transaminase [Pseudomonadota bacterium]
MIPYGRQLISQDDVNAVVDVLHSDYLTQGPTVPIFENAIADKVGVQFGVAVSSATAALHISCLALGLGDGDWLWTSPISFVASANCGLYCSAKVDFIDINPKTYNIDIETLKDKLKKAEIIGALPKIIIAVDFAGQSCDMKAIYELSQEYGFKIIEDASHAIGGKYKNRPVGSCAYCDIAIFSFHPVKIITTGEGGMALTNNHEIADHLKLLRSHGITRDASAMEMESPGGWYYEQIDLGFNYRMTDIQAALGLKQLEHLDEFISRRREIAEEYSSSLNELPLILPWQHPDSESSYHLYVVQIDYTRRSLTRADFFEFMRNNGVNVNVHYIPVYKQPYYKKYGYISDDCHHAESYYSKCLSLPIYPALTNNDQDKVVELCNEYFKSVI